MRFRSENPPNGAPTYLKYEHIAKFFKLSIN